MQQKQHDRVRENQLSNVMIRELIQEQQCFALSKPSKNNSPQTELHRRKQELALKRQIGGAKTKSLAGAAKLDSISQQIQSLERQLEKIKQIPVYLPQKSQFTDQVVAQEKLEKNKSFLQHQHKQQLVQRQKQYSKIVSDIYVPQQKFHSQGAEEYTEAIPPLYLQKGPGVH